MSMAAQQIIRREVAFLERDRLIMDDARKMMELVQSAEIVVVLEPPGDESPVTKQRPINRASRIPSGAV